MPTNAWTRFGARPERRNRLVCAGKWFSCLLLLAATGAAHAQNDVVELTTGNRLFGTIGSLYRGELRFSIAGAGTVNINWSNVELLESARVMDVELASGERLSGAVRSPSAKQLEVTTAQDRKDLSVSTRRFVGNRWFAELACRKSTHTFVGTPRCMREERMVSERSKFPRPPTWYPPIRG